MKFVYFGLHDGTIEPAARSRANTVERSSATTATAHA